MTRKSEIARVIIQRRWPHRVELPAESLRGAVNSTAMYGLAKELSCALPPQHMSRDGHELVVFRFPIAEAAQTFAGRFGGELLPLDVPRPRR